VSGVCRKGHHGEGCEKRSLWWGEGKIEQKTKMTGWSRVREKVKPGWGHGVQRKVGDGGALGDGGSLGVGDQIEAAVQVRGCLGQKGRKRCGNQAGNGEPGKRHIIRCAFRARYWEGEGNLIEWEEEGVRVYVTRTSYGAMACGRTSAGV